MSDIIHQYCPLCNTEVDHERMIDTNMLACVACGSLNPYDLFSDDDLRAHRKRYESIDQIEQELAAEDSEKKAARHAKHTRKPRSEGPEAKVQTAIRKHLETRWHALVLRTNAGHIKVNGDTIFLGVEGQSDLHVLLPLTAKGFQLAVFMAVEVKASDKDATDVQKRYQSFVRIRGGITVVAHNIIDVDDAINAYIGSLIGWLKGLGVG